MGLGVFRGGLGMAGRLVGKAVFLIEGEAVRYISSDDRRTSWTCQLPFGNPGP